MTLLGSDDLEISGTVVGGFEIDLSDCAITVVEVTSEANDGLSSFRPHAVRRAKTTKEPRIFLTSLSCTKSVSER